MVAWTVTREWEVTEFWIISILKIECTWFASGLECIMNKRGTKDDSIFRLSNRKKKSWDEEAIGKLDVGKKTKFGYE